MFNFPYGIVDIKFFKANKYVEGVSLKRFKWMGKMNLVV